MLRLLTLGLIILSSTALQARNIYGLDPDEIEDLDFCARMQHRLSYDKLNSLPNYAENLFRGGDLNNRLMHNFIADMNNYRSFSIDNSAIVSATIRHTNSAKITNSTISNMTFVGDVSQIDFTDSCLVNVRFPVETSWWTKRKIKRQARYTKNLEYKHEWEPYE